jgi:capsid protein
LVLSPIYEAFLSEEIAASRVAARGWTDPRIRAAWLYAQWTGEREPDIDPLKTLQAMKLGLELNATTFENLAMAYNGSSASSNMEKLREECEKYQAMPWTNKKEEITVDEKEGKTKEDIDYDDDEDDGDKKKQRH